MGRRHLVLNLRDQRPAWALPDRVVEALRADLPDGWRMTVVDAPADGRGDGAGASREALEAVADAEAYAGFGVPPEILEAGPGLRWVHSAAAGVGGSLSEAMRSSKVMFTNSAGVHAVPMAEWVIGAVLHFGRGFDVAVRAQAARSWDKRPFDAAEPPVRELADQRMGILGFGGIGREVATRAAALGMRVSATRRRPSGSPAGIELITGDGAAHEVAARSDVLVVCLPETDETRGMVSADLLAAIPEGALLINVARGGIVDETALVAALAEGRLRGAALDVTAREPLPEDSPLWGLPNVLITPHVSATSPRFWDRQMELIRTNLRRYFRGEPLVNEVDRAAGY